MIRRKGRILAFQALYSYDVGGVPLDELLKLEWQENEVEKDNNSEENASRDGASLETNSNEAEDFARLLISGTINHIDEIDDIIKKHLTGKWEFGRINKVSLAILRMSVFSLLYQKDLAPPIVIDEAISISKKYGTDDAFKFINAILDTISKEMQS